MDPLSSPPRAWPQHQLQTHLTTLSSHTSPSEVKGHQGNKPSSDHKWSGKKEWDNDSGTLGLWFGLDRTPPFDFWHVWATAEPALT